MDISAFSVIVNEKNILKQLNPDELDLVSTGPGSFNIIHNNQVFEAEVLEANQDEKAFKIKVNGNLYYLKIQDQYDQLIDKLGLNVANTNKVNEIKAPMPGLVLDILVETGASIEKSTPLLILEAMKMENVIKSPGEGVIKSVNVSKGDAVEKNAVLINLE